MCISTNVPQPCIEHGYFINFEVFGLHKYYLVVQDEIEHICILLTTMILEIDSYQRTNRKNV